MSRIDCDAARCVHNRDGRCHAAIIHVRGGPTNDSSKIHCGTYAFIRPAPHKRGEFLFETGTDMSPELENGQTNRIACNAARCKYFKDYECSAHEIHVRDPDFAVKKHAECMTFIPE